MSNAEIFGPNDPGPRDAKDANYTGSNGGNSGGGSTGPGGGNGAAAKPFPWERLAFTVLFAFVAWFAFWLALVLALISGALALFGQSSQESFAGYARKASDYLASTLAYVSGATNEKPFPFG